MKKKPLAPVKPVGLEILFFYPCPHCEHQVPVLALNQELLVSCEFCQFQFPIVPVDKKGILYIKTILANGAAAVDPDFL